MKPLAALLQSLFLAAPLVAAGPVDYLRDVKPLLNTRCYACHGALQQKGKLRLDTAALMKKGGRQGPAVVPGKSGESTLIDAVTGSNGIRRMPPENEGVRLTAPQVALLREWIDHGAVAPDEPTPEDPRKHWAFQPPVRPARPAVADTGWVRNPVDAFVAVEQAKRRLVPSAPAARSTLLRRVYLDLTGLPPSSEALHAFLADTTEDAYERVVDQLLASPQYGERWARHWMDIWRYADWYGRRAVPDVWNSAPQIWRWRDWIVRSLNADKGYDRMVQEMLAGDEIAPGDDEAAAATGYLVRNWYALNPNQWMRDNVEHTGKAFLGLTFNCCHCHDHKYDPIRQEDYFHFRAFFEPINLRQDWVEGEPDPGPFQKYEYVVLRKVVPNGRVCVFDEKLDAQTVMYRLGDERNKMDGKPPVGPGMPAFLGGDRIAVAPVQLPPVVSYPALKPFIRHELTIQKQKAVADARIALEAARRGLSAAQRNLADVEDQVAGVRLPPPALADRRAQLLVVVEGERKATARLVAAEAEMASIAARLAADAARHGQGPGDVTALAKAAGRAERIANVRAAEEKLLIAELALGSSQRWLAVAVTTKGQATKAVATSEAGFTAAKKAVEAAQKALATDSDKYTPLSPVYPSTSSGRRKALALWITARTNPLAARVAVNHVWLRHFGRPIVDSVFDLGRNGKRPSHPELLDWLAVELMENDWSLKHLHRLIVTSSTYRMGSKPAPGSKNATIDQDNRYLWQFPRRRLEAEAVRDSVLAAACELDSTPFGRPVDNAQEAATRRRSLYFDTYPEDGGHMKFLTLFDAPDPCDCYRRSESILPQQALVLTNSRLLLDQSRLLARKLWERTAPLEDHESAFIAAAFEQVLTRLPSSEEVAICREFLSRQTSLIRAAPPAPSDAGVAPAANPEQRAREGLVRALFSHDDFVTLR